MIELVGLAEQRETRVRTLSGGQLRRLDLALALVGDPELIFLDEPTTGFDPAARRQAWETIRDLRSLGKSILLTTHYMEEAQRLADRVAILRGRRSSAPARRGSSCPAMPRSRSATAETGARSSSPQRSRRVARADRPGARRRRRARGARSAPAEPRGRLPRAHGRGGCRVRLFLHELGRSNSSSGATARRPSSASSSRSCCSSSSAPSTGTSPSRA